jgi:DNA-binding GntR family transcriptional regulator
MGRNSRPSGQKTKRIAPESAGETVHTPTKLQRQLAHGILSYVRDNNLGKGDLLSELALAQTLLVSRTPIRGALEYLTSLDVLVPSGSPLRFRVRASASVIAKLAAETVISDEEAIYVRIAEDYVRQALPEEFSEADIMRQYGIRHRLLMRVLQTMTREGVIERKAGYGWRFAPMLRTSGKGDEQSYRFRLAIEPIALLEPGFSLDRSWAKRCRSDHEAILAMRPERVSMIRFFDMNADFHETLAACSGNPFFHQATKSQNQLRRFLTYSRVYALERIKASCEAHLTILDALENGDQELAALQMRLHLQVAARQLPVQTAAASEQTPAAE